MAKIMAMRQKLNLLIGEARHWRGYLAQAITDMAADACSATCMTYFFARVDAFLQYLVILEGSSADVVAYIREEIESPSFDVLGRATELIAAIDAAKAEIRNIVPMHDDGTYLWWDVVREDTVGGGMAWRRMTPAETATLRTLYQAIIDKLPEFDPRG